MPAAPMSAGRRFGVFLAISLTLLFVVAGVSDSVGQADLVAALAGASAFVAWLLVGLSAVRSRQPDVADRIEIAASAVMAAKSFRRNHLVTGAAWSANAAALHSSSQSRQRREASLRGGDQEFWSEITQQPVENQWQAADWFRASLQAEYVRRTGGLIPLERTPVPDYESVASHLYHNPQAW
jgi:hypothetical protein